MDILRGLDRSTLLLVVAGVFTLAILGFWSVFRTNYDSREPPIIPHVIPYAGHIIGIFRYGAKYFDIVNRRFDYPIYTLPTFGSRTYIVKSPAIAALVQRSSKTTSFYSAALEFTRRLIALDGPAMDIIWRNVNGNEGDDGLMPESHAMISSVLGPGPVLNGITQLQLDEFSNIIGDMNPVDGSVVDLYRWVRDQLTTSNANALYGPQNLFAMHPELVEDFWVFEEGMISLLADVLPWITARKSYRARERVLGGLVEFVEKDWYKKASPLIQKRVSINLKHGLTKKMAGHAELILVFAILGNAVPTTFWLLINIFSRPPLLTKIRQEIDKAVVITISDDGKKERRTVHVDMFKSFAPLLLSTFRETLRLIANLSSVRYVLQDTIIGDQYLLKKDSIIQIASGVIHTDEDIWGPDAGDFDPSRFITTTPEASISGPTTEKTSTAPLPKNVPSAAFRAFGGGSVICPGRHFAQSEIVGFVAAVIIGFDIEEPGGGTIGVPEKNDSTIPFAVMKPKAECKVSIKRRKGMEEVIWALEL